MIGMCDGRIAVVGAAVGNTAGGLAFYFGSAIDVQRRKRHWDRAWEKHVNKGDNNA
jgi:hypothetical protein